MKCILDGEDAVREVDGFLLLRKEATVPVCFKHYVGALLYEEFAQDRIRNFLGKRLRGLGIPKGALPRIKVRSK